MEVPISERVTPPVSQAAVGQGHDEWSQPSSVRADDDENWVELDADAPDGTGG
jgi:hypothetical protein